MTFQLDSPGGARLRTLFAGVFGVPEGSVSPDTSPENLDEWDSFGHMRLVMAIEKELDVSLSMEQITAIDSFAALVAVLDGAA